MALVFDKSRPMPAWIHPATESVDRGWLRAIWQAQPAWADVNEMRAIFRRARRQGRHVDHIVPLRHSHVCGLHAPANLRIIRPIENLAKGNRHWPDMWGEQAGAV